MAIFAELSRSLYQRSLVMAHDSNANAWINMVKKTKKEYSDGMNEYYLKFVKGKEVPTAGDVANLTKLYNEMKKEADIDSPRVRPAKAITRP